MSQGKEKTAKKESERKEFKMSEKTQKIMYKRTDVGNKEI